jgi:hypothetical protein
MKVRMGRRLVAVIVLATPWLAWHSLLPWIWTILGRLRIVVLLPGVLSLFAIPLMVIGVGYVGMRMSGCRPTVATRRAMLAIAAGNGAGALTALFAVADAVDNAHILGPGRSSAEWEIGCGSAFVGALVGGLIAAVLQMAVSNSEASERR